MTLQSFSSHSPTSKKAPLNSPPSFLAVPNEVDHSHSFSDLPYETISAILLLASTPSTSPPHGGSVQSWHSHEAAAPLSLVCRAWRAPAQAVLFSSVPLIGRRQTQRFLDAVASRPDLSKRTSHLVLGVDPHQEASRNGTLGQLATSELLVEVLERCPAAIHIAIRPLHQDVRLRLFATLFSPSRGLRTIVLAPRVLTSIPWSGNLWSAEDATTPLPRLENMEITSWLAPARPGHAADPSKIEELALKRVRVHYEYPLLLEALKKSKHLEWLDLYHEVEKPIEDTVEALTITAPNIRELRFICNPTHLDPELASPRLDGASVPLFDRILPLYTSLTSLHVSSTDISPSALLSLPPRLQRLHIKSLSTTSVFTCSALLAVLRERDDLVFPDTFEELIVVDAPEQWGLDSPVLDSGAGTGADGGGAEEVKQLLRARGVKFTFRMDFEEENETSSTSRTMSGTPRGMGSARGTRENTSTASSVGSRATEGDEQGGDDGEEEATLSSSLSSSLEQRSNVLVTLSSDGEQ